MKGGTLSFEISQPFTPPGIRATAMPAAIPATMASAGGIVVPAMLVAWAATTDDNPMMKPTERSMPPAMMTNVSPSARSRGATAKTAMD